MDFAAEIFSHELLTITDGEDRNICDEIEIEVGRIFGESGFGSAGENNGIRFSGLDVFAGRLPRDHFGVTTEFTDAPNDELGVLPTKVDHRNKLMVHGRMEYGAIGMFPSKSAGFLAVEIDWHGACNRFDCH